MKRLIRIAAGLLAACITALSPAAFPAVPASAAGIPVLVGYRDDINNDTIIDRSDVSLLQAYLLGDSAETNAAASAHLKDADLDGSQSLNAKDLTLLKRIALHIDPPVPIYDDSLDGDQRGQPDFALCRGIACADDRSQLSGCTAAAFCRRDPTAVLRPVRPAVSEISAGKHQRILFPRFLRQTEYDRKGLQLHR